MVARRLVTCSASGMGSALRVVLPLTSNRRVEPFVLSRTLRSFTFDFHFFPSSAHTRKVSSSLIKLAACACNHTSHSQAPVSWRQACSCLPCAVASCSAASVNLLISARKLESSSSAIAFKWWLRKSRGRAYPRPAGSIKASISLFLRGVHSSAGWPRTRQSPCALTTQPAASCITAACPNCISSSQLILRSPSRSISSNTCMTAACPYTKPWDTLAGTSR